MINDITKELFKQLIQMKKDIIELTDQPYKTDKQLLIEIANYNNINITDEDINDILK